MKRAGTTRLVTALVIGVVAVLVAGTVWFTTGRSSSSVDPSNAATGLCKTPPGDATADSVARVWNEQTLDAIRRDFPAPTVHARNLFHLSAAMFDAWLAVDPDAEGMAVFVDRADLEASPASLDPDALAGAQNVTVSYAAYVLVTHRYSIATGAEESLAAFDATMESLCLSTDVASLEPGSPAATGVAVAESIIEQTRNDGSNEPSGYVDLSYASVNPPLVVDQPGTEMVDPNRWQPLSLENAVTRNGQPLASNVQEFVGPSWGFVTPFALPESADGLPIDPGAPPLLGVDDAVFAANALEVLQYGARLDTNALTADERAEADYGRVVAEFWADGPDSETPPGHWNTIANDVSDRLAQGEGNGLRIGGAGDEVDRLEWDIKLGLALNGSLHDAAIAAWGAKAHFDYVRPISMIRHLAQTGELPLEPGLVERITDESTAPGERHEHLADAVGEIAVFGWQGQPNNPANQILGIGWIRASEWLPYQRATFVTPAFAAYVSGHSAFSRAGAEVLTAITGSPDFPGGPLTHVVKPGELIHEEGPAATVTLSWPTYLDAAEEAGVSRLYGGIHVWPDHEGGRAIGDIAGKTAWELALVHFGP